MLVMCVGVSIFLLTYVFPKLTPMFAAKKMDVPKPTLIMMALSGALTNYWYLFVIGGLLLGGFLIYVRRQPWGRRAFDWLWMHLPILGPLVQKVALSRSLRTLASTINAGVPMLEALELSAGVANNHFYEQCWRNVGDQVMSGRQIHEALEGNKLIPATLQQMIASGEATGKLGQILNKVSDYFDREVANAVKSATSMIEPLMVAVMGTAIGTIALAMLLPIFKLSSGH
jgi:type IV pilus assembly protein PilC